MRRRHIVVLTCLICGLILALIAMATGRSSIPVTNAAAAASVAPCPGGCTGPSFPANPYKSDFSPTGEKPQSKLWYNDGRWWASMLHTDGKYYIFYLDGTSWVKTVTLLDDRLPTQADCLWDAANNKLYVASGAGTEANGINLDARLYSYTYNAILKTYTLDPGFPVTIRSGGAETIVIDKDSTGQLWTTYTQGNKVWIRYSTSSDHKTWSAPFNPPAPANSNVHADDISSLVAANGKIVVLWSNQNDQTFYYAIHDDTAADNVWQSGTAWSKPGTPVADDHINLKSVQTDGNGYVFAVVKTSQQTKGAGNPRIAVLRRAPSGNWSVTSVWDEMNNMHHTRPILLIDSVNRRLYVFATRDTSGGDIVYKPSLGDYTTDAGFKFNSPSTDAGAVFIMGNLNDPTSTKQTVNGSTELVVLANDENQRFYKHNVLDLPGTAPTPTPTPTATPTPTVIVPAVNPTATPTPTPTPRPAPEPRAYIPLVVQ